MKIIPLIVSTMTLFTLNTALQAAPCVFDSNKNCTIQRDILNDIGPNGLKYYASTNYDHRKSGEINIFKAELTQPYKDNINAPGQIKFLAMRAGTTLWHSGEFMTREDLHLPPYNSPVKSNRWTTQEIKHGYLEVVVKMPKCDSSTDGKCQANTQPNTYQTGLWPAIWLLPNLDTAWPTNGEIDISEAYLRNTDFKTSTAAIHFNGNDPRCGGNDCKFQGVPLTRSIASAELWKSFHTWGFEWQPDPASANGGQILNGYFDNVKVWGPLRTDTLPADGPGALQRGFNDPKGGYYLIVNLALGGGYAGAPNAQMQTSSMYVQSAKAYAVDSDVPPPPPTDDNGIIQINAASQSDPECITAKDNFFIDAETTGQAFTVDPTGCVYKWVPVGAHKVRLTSQAGIPAANNLPGVCKSTLDKTDVTVEKNLTSFVLATYRYEASTAGKFAYNLVLGSPFLPVIVNGSIKCPGADGKTSCLISGQVAGTSLTIQGQGTNFCNLQVKTDGSLIIGTGSSKCFAVTRPATPTTPGRINLNGGF